MFRKRLAITMFLLIILSALSIAIYFTLSSPGPDITKAQQKQNNDTKEPSVQTMNSGQKFDKNIVTQKTKVKLIYTYFIDNSYTIEREIEDNKAIGNIVGMNEAQVREFYNNMNYKVINFSTDEITVKAEIINSWPPECYVVKSLVDEIVIYKVDSQGMLTLPTKTGIFLEMLPKIDSDAVKKGKIYDKMEEVEELLDDYKS